MPTSTLHAIRTVGAWAAVWIVSLAWGAYAAYGVYVAAQLHQRCDYQWPPKGERWNPEYYLPGSEPLLRRDRLWQRWKWPLLIAAVVLGNTLYFLIAPAPGE